MKRTFRFITVTLSLLLLAVAFPIVVSAEVILPQVVLTEICYNPTFMENDKDLADTADVLEYVEFVNISEETVSLEGITLQYSKDGYGGTFKTNSVLALEGNSLTLASGEIAVIAIYNADTATAGLAYATADERRAYYDFFVEFYACADRLDANHFYIAPAVESSTGTPIDGAFRLGNKDENVVVRICGESGEILCEAGYSAATWNRNWFSMNLIYRPGIVEGHPKASKDYNIAGCTPGMIRDNQITSEGLIPTGETVPLKVMEYNVCAENTKQTYPDGSQPTMDERIEMVFDVIEGHGPDVIGLTEINYLWLPYLETNLTCEGGTHAAYGRSGQGSTYGSGKYSGQKWDLFSLILWRVDKYELVEQGSFWGSRTPNRPNSCTWLGLTGDMGRAMNWVILKDKASGVEFFFLCAHLDAKVEEVRTLSAELIRKKATELAAGRPIIMVGDWNVNERKPAYDELTCDGFADARYRTADPEDMTIFNTYNKWGEYTDEYTTRPPIDHCFITPANVFVDNALMDQAFIDEAKTMYASDHNATVFSLKLLKPHTEPETETPTEPVTEAITEVITQVITQVPTAEETTEKASAETEALQGGCGSVVLPAIAVLLPLVAMTFCRRREV
ncbi:MAG: endonuclease/exonuclease/phosphatase family protein [Clostridia bacterium]|nr:endonuclease/exonuclease/phosphatase family protein [Clostridia bacterium]